MIRAVPSDRPEIEAFLTSYAATSMFPLSNLARHGMAGGHPRAVTFWISRNSEQITDVLGISQEGMVFPQCPTSNWAAAAKILRGRTVKGVIGDAAQVAALRQAVNLLHPARLDGVEPCYALHLSDLQMPDTTDLVLKPLTAVSRDDLIVWRAGFCTETLAMDPQKAVKAAEGDIERYIKGDSHRALFHGQTPIGMTGFNATLPNMVQIGGVYTPPALRNRGYGRAAVALHLQEATQNGVTQAVLFAANQSAERAYQAIGFQRDGSFTLAIYDQPQVVHG